ncbi:ankyrin repeat domain-containing protein [Shewanella sp. 202IG2-18]|uniref:ankyrin repeat domain-containing protein n=1 Tax=Parashewanella hymeniacidonis TaxID=2807618 RepID=UPI00196054AF|nr:ankyrin repeat domain-containing protein [Parashewanella hymeniacidonis]MBM7072542.1 ankyrin repeat domain-containing protein [Parashewanella hymeniacidonis]
MSVATGFNTKSPPDDIWVVCKTPDKGEGVYEEFSLSNIDKTLTDQKRALESHFESHLPQYSSVVNILYSHISGLSLTSIRYRKLKSQLCHLNSLLTSSEVQKAKKVEVLTALSKQLNSTPRSVELERLVISLNFNKAKLSDLLANAETRLLKEAKTNFRKRFSDEVTDEQLNRIALRNGYPLSIEETSLGGISQSVIEQYTQILNDTMCSGSLILQVSMDWSKSFTLENLEKIKKLESFDEAHIENCIPFSSVTHEHFTHDSQYLKKSRHLAKVLYIALIHRACPLLKPDDENGVQFQQDDDVIWCHSDSVFYCGSSHETESPTPLAELANAKPMLDNASDKQLLLFNRHLLLCTHDSTSFSQYLRELASAVGLPKAVKSGIKAMLYHHFQGHDKTKHVDGFPPCIDFDFLELAQTIESENLMRRLEAIKNNESESSNKLEHLIKLLKTFNYDCCSKFKDKLFTAIKHFIGTQHFSSQDIHYIAQSLPDSSKDLKKSLQELCFNHLCSEIDDLKDIEGAVDLLVSIPDFCTQDSIKYRELCEKHQSKFKALVAHKSSEELIKIIELLTGKDLITSAIGKELNFISYIHQQFCKNLQGAKTLDELQARMETIDPKLVLFDESQSQLIKNSFNKAFFQLNSSDHLKLNVELLNPNVSADELEVIWNKAVEDDNPELIVFLHQNGVTKKLKSSLYVESVVTAVSEGKPKCYKTLFELARGKIEKSNSILSELMHKAIKHKTTEYLEPLRPLNNLKESCREKVDGSTPFLCAVMNGNKAQAEWFLRHCPTVIEDKNDSYQTAFHLACDCQGTEILKELISLHTDDELINHFDSNGLSPLLMVCKTGKKPFLTELLKCSHLDLSACEAQTGRSGLHLAVAEGKESIVSILLGKSKSFLDSKDNNNETPIGLALTLGQFQMLDKCLETWPDFDFSSPVSKDKPLMAAICSSPTIYQGKYLSVAIKHADLDSNYGEQGQTIFHLAAASGFYFKELSKGVSVEQVSARDSNGQAPIHIAATNGHVDVFKVLAKEGANIQALSSNPRGKNSLYFAVKSGKIKFVETAFQRGVSLTTTAQGLKELLCTAVENNQGEMVIFLLKKCQYKKQFSALLKDESINLVMLAAEHNSGLVIKSLPKAYITECFKRSTKFNPFMEAARLNNSKAVGAMISYCQDELMHRTEQGLTAVHIAIENDSFEALKVMGIQKSLLSEAINSSSSSYFSYTPLMYAASLNKKAICKLLLTQLEDAQSQTNNQGLNAAHIAVKHNSVDAIQVFPITMLNTRINGEGTSWNGYTCLHIAAFKDSAEMIRQLIKQSANLSISAFTNGDLAYVPLTVAVIQGSESATFEILQHTKDLSIIFEKSDDNMSEELIELKQSGFSNKKAVSEFAYHLFLSRIPEFNYKSIRQSIWSKFKEFNP